VEALALIGMWVKPRPRDTRRVSSWFAVLGVDGGECGHTHTKDSN